MEQKCNSISRYKSESNDSSKNARSTSHQITFVQEQQQQQQSHQIIQNLSQNLRMESNPSSPSTAVCTPVANSNIPDSTFDMVKFKWVCPDESTFPDVSIPCLLRKSNNNNYFCVRIIEKVLLSKFENMISDELKRFGNLNAYHCEQNEINTLNEINDNHMNKEYGQEPFGLNDRLVECEHFYKFYEILKRTCRLKPIVNPPSSISTRITRRPHASRHESQVTYINQAQAIQPTQTLHNTHYQSSSMHNQVNLPVQSFQMLNNLPVNQMSTMNNNNPSIYSTHVSLRMLPQRPTNISLINPNSTSLIRPLMPSMTNAIQRQPSPQPMLQPVELAQMSSNSNFVPAPNRSINTCPYPLNNSMVNASFHTNHEQMNTNAPIYNSNQNANPTFVNVNNDFMYNTSRESVCVQQSQDVHLRHLINTRRSSASPADSQRVVFSNVQHVNPTPPKNQVQRFIFHNESGQRPIGQNRRTTPSTVLIHTNQPNQIVNYQQQQQPLVQEINRHETHEQPVYQINDDNPAQAPEEPRQEELESEHRNSSTQSGQTISTHVSTAHQMNDTVNLSNANSTHNLNSSNTPDLALHQNQHQVQVETQLELAEQVAIHQQIPTQQEQQLDTLKTVNVELNKTSKIPTTTSEHVSETREAAVTNQQAVMHVHTLPHEYQAITEPMTPEVSSLLPSTNVTSEQLITRNEQDTFNNAIEETVCTNDVNSEQAMLTVMIDNNNNTNNSNNVESNSFTTLTTYSDVSSSINKQQARNRAKKDVLFTSTSHKTHFGYLQINNAFMPYICILEPGYRCLPKYPNWVKYVSLKHLVYMGYVENNLYLDKKILKQRFSTYYIADMNQLCQFDSLYEQLNAVLSDKDFKFDFHAEYGIMNNNLDELFELVNLAEFIFFNNSKPIYMQLISNAHLLALKKTEQYEEVLAYNGGLIQLDAVKNKPEKRIVPFLDMHGEMILVPYANVSHLIKDDPDFEANVVEFKGEAESKIVNRFLQLLLFFICVDVDMKTARFVNIKSWLTKQPDMFFKLCIFDSEFPAHWNRTFTASTKVLTNRIAQQQQQQQQIQQFRSNSYILPQSIHLNPNEMQSVTLSPLSIDSSSPSPALANGLMTHQSSTILYQIVEQPVTILQQPDELVQQQQQQQTSNVSQLIAPSPGLFNLEAQLFSPASLLTSLQQPHHEPPEPHESHTQNEQHEPHESHTQNEPLESHTQNEQHEPHESHTQNEPLESHTQNEQHEPHTLNEPHESHTLNEPHESHTLNEQHETNEQTNASDQIVVANEITIDESNTVLETHSNQQAPAQQSETIADPNSLNDQTLTSSCVEISSAPVPPNNITVENLNDNEQIQTCLSVVATSTASSSLNIEQIASSELNEKNRKSETTCISNEEISKSANKRSREELETCEQISAESKRKRHYSDSVLCVHAVIECFIDDKKAANKNSDDSDSMNVEISQTESQTQQPREQEQETNILDTQDADINQMIYDLVQAQTPMNEPEQQELAPVQRANVSYAKKATSPKKAVSNKNPTTSKTVTTPSQSKLDSKSAKKSTAKSTVNSVNQTIDIFLKPNSTCNSPQPARAQNEQKVQSKKSSSLTAKKSNVTTMTNRKSTSNKSQFKFDKSIFTADSDKSNVSISEEEEQKKESSSTSSTSTSSSDDEDKNEATFSKRKRKRTKSSLNKNNKSKRIAVNRKTSSENRAEANEDTFEIYKQKYNLKSFKICLKKVSLEEIDSYKKSSFKNDEKASSQSTVSTSKVNTPSTGTVLKKSLTSSSSNVEQIQPVKQSPQKQTVVKKIDKKSKANVDDSDDSDLPEIDLC